jgi:hypothetical protein
LALELVINRIVTDGQRYVLEPISIDKQILTQWHEYGRDRILEQIGVQFFEFNFAEGLHVTS